MKSTRFPFALTLLAASLLPMMGSVRAEEPISLKLSQTVTRDSNFSRSTTPISETISQTGVLLKLDKPYGRQRYTTSARLGLTKFSEYADRLNNRNYDVNAGFSTGIASNWDFSLNTAASENLNPSQENPNDNRLVKNVVSTRATGMDLRYGVSGRWAMVGSIDTNKTTYSLPQQQTQNRSQNSVGFRVVYLTSDLLNFGLGTTQSATKYPDLLVVGVPEEVDQRSLDVSSNWQVTGFSSLNSVISVVKNKYKSDPAAGYNELTGRVNWNFTPRGSTSYVLALSRSTDSDASQTKLRTSGFQDNALNNITTALNGSVRWVPTAKLGFGAGLGLNHYDIKGTQGSVTSNPASTSKSSRYVSMSLSTDYQYSRSVGLGCNFNKYKQTADITRIAFDGRLFGCNASFTID